MKTSTLVKSFLLLLLLEPLSTAIGDDESAPPKEDENVAVPSEQDSGLKKRYEHRKYLTDHPQRSDAGIFYVGFAAGGNFYVEPEVSSTTKIPTGGYFKDFGFQGGVYFDFDYSRMPENIPLGLRGMVGYKYILSSTHVFSFDGMVRRMFIFSENASFGLGFGASASFWYRTITNFSPDEEMIFMPSLIAGAGFEFNPFMVDFKWLVNRLGPDSSRTGFELYFGFRL